MQGRGENKKKKMKIAQGREKGGTGGSREEGRQAPPRESGDQSGQSWGCSGRQIRRLSRGPRSRTGRGGSLPGRAMMKVEVAVARPGPVRADKAGRTAEPQTTPPA